MGRGTGMGGMGMGMGSSAMPCASCPAAAASSAPPFTPDVRAAVDRALEAERGAEAGYRKDVSSLGDRPPFSRVANAEGRHAWVLENLYLGRGLVPPKNEVNAATLPTYAKVADACAGAVASEKKIVAMYDELLARTDLPDDVRNAFVHLREISRERHLPMFESCK